MQHLNIVGGGLGGLVAANCAAEAGYTVELHEATNRLGGRAGTTDGDFRANIGPHVIYDDGDLWDWLQTRSLTTGARRVPLTAPVSFRINGRARHNPGIGLVRALRRVRRSTAPVESTFTEWADELIGERHARQLANFAGVVTYDHDPGRLSAQFVQERLRRATRIPPAARYMPGGWVTMIERLTQRAMDLGVTITTGQQITELPDSPVILAIPNRAAAKLIGGDDLIERGSSVVCLDIGLKQRRSPRFIVADLDASGWVETFSRADPTLAPGGHHLIQAQAGLRPGESMDEGVKRLEELVDVAHPKWRDQQTWRRQLLQVNKTGAVDLPNSTWRDRTRIDRGNDVKLVNDQVAAPGLLSDVTTNAAIQAVSELLTAARA